MSNCEDQPISTDSELSATFGNGSTLVGVLPSTPNGSSERDAKGKLLNSTLSTIVSNLKTSGKIPSPTGANPQDFVVAQGTLLANLQSEYCFYESRYKYALLKVFNGIREGNLAKVDTDALKIKVNSDLVITKMLNLRLNDLMQIMNAIKNSMISTSDTITNQIETYNATIKAQKESLDKQNKIINTGEAVTNIRKEMVKYTEEKARYTDNLLNLYSFLNIVTLGLLVYIYKAAGNE